MGLRSFIKDFGEGLDEILTQKTGPSSAPPGQEAATSSARPCLLPPSPPTSEGGPERLLFTTSEELFDIGEDMHLFLSPTHIQIHSPEHIEEALLRPFRSKHKPVLLVNVHKGKGMSATLHTIDQASLTVDTAHSTLFFKPGTPLLVVFPVLPQRDYVLQTTVEAVYVNRLKLHYKDPRYDRRWRLPQTIPATVHVAPGAVMRAMTQQPGGIRREMTQAADETTGLWTGHLVDGFHARDDLEPLDPIEAFKASPSLRCHLLNISRGGVGVRLPDPSPLEALRQHVILLSIELPRVPLGMHGLRLWLTLLGVVRHVRATPPGLTLHIRFFQRLPQELDALFEHLQEGPTGGTLRWNPGGLLPWARQEP